MRYKIYIRIAIFFAVFIFTHDVFAVSNVHSKDNVTTHPSNVFSSIERFRSETYTDISISRIETEQRINLLDKISKSQSLNDTKNQKVLDATEKPIAYIRLFLLSASAFIFSGPLIFYSINVLLIILIVRFIYFKLKHK